MSATTWHEAFMGLTTDHLYAECPARKAYSAEPMRCVDRVDPLGTDICGWCVRVWKARHRHLEAK